MLAGITLVAFLAATLGTYFALPYIDPERAADQEMMVEEDTLSSDVAESHEALASLERLEALVDTMDQHRHVLAAKQRIEAQERELTQLRDSLSSVHDSLDTAASRASNLDAEVDDLREQLASLEDARAEAEEISQTLAQLEMRELRAVLDPLGLDVYESLYTISSGRNQDRLLQAMPPDEAARLVHRIVARDDESAPSLPDDEPGQ